MTEVVGAVQELTILFANIRNFTFLARQLSLQELRAFLTEFFDIVADVVSSWKGTLDKFIGDAALLIYGAPVSQD